MQRDEFERGYLPTDDEVVHRERVIFRAAFAILAAITGGSGILSTIALVAAVSGEPGAIVGGIFMAVMTGIVGLASVTGTVLRTIVTKREIIVHAGIRRELRIPVAAVTGIALVPYDSDARQRTVAQGPDGFAAIVAGKLLVRIEWTDVAARARSAFVGSEDPASLAEAIGRARSSSIAAQRAEQGAIAQVRIAEDASSDVADAAEEHADENVARASADR